MDSTVLVDKKFDIGQQLIQALDNRNLYFPVALWIKEEEKDWVLVFGVNDLKQKKVKDILLKIYQVIKDDSLPLSLTDIKLLDNHDALLKTLRMLIITGPNPSQISFFGNFINGHRFPDAVIYRVA